MGPMPTLLPMLASPAGHLPPLEGWTIEPKWDGIRVIAEASTKRVRLWSRNGIDKARQFSEVSEALAELAEAHGSMVLDGELVAVDRSGKPLRFQALQARAITSTRTAFVAFDCLAAFDEVLIAAPWTERRVMLERLVKKSARGLIRRGDSFPCGSAGAARVFAPASEQGGKGLILKRMDAPYAPGRRTPAWRKVKFEYEQEFVI